MANYGGYKYFIDEIKSKLNNGFVKFLDDINMDGNRIVHVGNPIETTDAVNLSFADIRYGGKNVDNIWGGTNLFNGNTILTDLEVDGTSQFNDTVSILSDLTITGKLGLTGLFELDGDLKINGKSTFLGTTNLFNTETSLPSEGTSIIDILVKNTSTYNHGIRIAGNSAGQNTSWIHLYDYSDNHRINFDYTGSDQSHSITHRDKNGTIKKAERWSHTAADNCEVIGGSLANRIGNSMLSVIGALATSGDFGVGGDSIFDGDVFAKSSLIFNEGGVTDPHIGWDTDTLHAYADEFYFKNTAGTQDLMTATTSGLKMWGKNVFDTGDLIPETDNASDLGSSTKAYKDGYFKGNVGIGRTPTFKLDTYTVAGPNIVLSETASNSDAVFKSKTALGEWSCGVGVGVAENCWNIYDHTNSRIPFKITSTGIISTPKQSGFRAERATTNQSVGDASATVLICNSENYDIQNEYNTSTGVFTAKTAGKYTFSAGVVFENNGTGNRRIFIYKGSSPIAEMDINAIQGAFNSVITVSTEIDLAVGNTVSIRVYQNSGGDLDVYANTRTFFAGHKIA